MGHGHDFSTPGGAGRRGAVGEHAAIALRVAAFSHPERRTGQGRKEPHPSFSLFREHVLVQARESYDVPCLPQCHVVHFSRRMAAWQSDQSCFAGFAVKNCIGQPPDTWNHGPKTWAVAGMELTLTTRSRARPVEPDAGDLLVDRGGRSVRSRAWATC